MTVIEPARVKTGGLGRSLHRTARAAYDGSFDNDMAWVEADDRKASPPDAVADAILHAAVDRSERRRDAVTAGLTLAMRRALRMRCGAASWSSV